MALKSCDNCKKEIVFYTQEIINRCNDFKLTSRMKEILKDIDRFIEALDQ